MAYKILKQVNKICREKGPADEKEYGLISPVRKHWKDTGEKERNVDESQARLCLNKRFGNPHPPPRPPPPPHNTNNAMELHQSKEFSHWKRLWYKEKLEWASQMIELKDTKELGLDFTYFKLARH